MAELGLKPIRPQDLPELLITTTGACKLFGIDAGSLSGMVTNDIIRPAVKRGKYQLVKFAEDYLAHLRRQGRGGTHGGVLGRPRKEGVDLQAKLRLDGARASIAELELAEKRGEVAPIADHEAWLTHVCTEIRSRLMQFPARAAQSAHDAATDGTVNDCEAAIREAAREILEVLSDGAADRADQLERARARLGTAPRDRDDRIGINGAGELQGNGRVAPPAAAADGVTVG